MYLCLVLIMLYEIDNELILKNYFKIEKCFLILGNLWLWVLVFVCGFIYKIFL